MTYRAFTGARPRRAYPWHLLWVLAVGVPCLLAACTVPEHMEVRAGKDPRNQDDDVRFRTTYYFRVFDACGAVGEANGTVDERQIIPETDSLYRYQMTGKAFSLFTNVHFEAGVLKSYEIDPFGANVVFDPDTNRFSFKSRQQTEKEAAREADYRELTRLIELRRNNVDPADAKALSGPTIKKIDALIERKLDMWSEAPARQSAESSPPDGETTGPEPDAGECSKDRLRRRGFQILGPEGWRTFDQDERLLLTMSSSGKPLISTMKDLSARVLNEQSDRSASMLPLIQERLKISKTRRKMDALEPTLPPGEASASAFGNIVKSVRVTFDEQP